MFGLCFCSCMHIDSYPFQQNNNILYLTGFNEPDCCLMIHRSHRDTSVSFFTVKNSPNALLWSGPVAGIEGVKELFGIQNVYGVEDLQDAVAALKDTTIYLDFEAAHSGFKEFSGLKNTKQLAPLIQKLRIRKEPEEIALLRQSGRIASESFTEVRLWGMNRRVVSLIHHRLYRPLSTPSMKRRARLKLRPFLNFNANAEMPSVSPMFRLWPAAIVAWSCITLTTISCFQNGKECYLWTLVLFILATVRTLRERFRFQDAFRQCRRHFTKQCCESSAAVWRPFDCIRAD